MSDLEKPVPPSGEEIHLPGGSLHPLLLTVGVTATLLGVTSFKFLLVGGIILTVVVLFKWIQEARAEMASLPAHHADH
ncbi:hypothetical protein DSM112329_03451 [Paraconexibacter sp. AEG42_29]|uniref:Cytochrome c oxidase polypeptide IV n=1 Tax=Paraconexibacter sp. AEG42_29 TaxID=2997339 RepID=A0AAU7AY40_9ACTN